MCFIKAIDPTNPYDRGKIVANEVDDFGIDFYEVALEFSLEDVEVAYEVYIEERGFAIFDCGYLNGRAYK